MNYFLTLQNTYQMVEIGFFSQKSTLLDRAAIDKTVASKDLIPVIDQLLKKHRLTITQLPFMVVNQGPGPFTTLRVVISTANGLSFAAGVPLIGVDALEAMHAEWHNHTYPYTIVLFNAFAGDVYFAIGLEGNILFKGYKPIDQLLIKLQKIDKPMYLVGNGVLLYRENIKQALGSKAILADPVSDYCSLETIGSMGYAQWQSGDTGTYQLLPLYLKQHPAEQINSKI
jgi:tRNA threonylcarbamoyladenosine biosynthesis protein TsaB